MPEAPGAREAAWPGHQVSHHPRAVLGGREKSGGCLVRILFAVTMAPHSLGPIQPRAPPSLTRLGEDQDRRTSRRRDGCVSDARGCICAADHTCSSAREVELRL